MHRGVVLVIAVGLVVAPVTAISAPGVLTPYTRQSTPNVAQQNTSIAPGAQLMGVVDAHHTDHSGVLGLISAQRRIAAQTSTTAKAEALTQIYETYRSRLDALEARHDTLEAALANGSITQSEFRARHAVLTVELRKVEEMGVFLEQKANDLAIWLIWGISVTIDDLEALQARAQALQGDYLVDIAPSFATGSAAGPDGGSGSSGDDGGTTTTSVATNVSAVIEDAAARVETAREKVQEAETTLDGLVISDETAELLDEAQQNLSLAEQRLAAARHAKAAGNEEKAERLATEAIDYANTAISKAEAAIDAATTT